ncbi:ABC transporter ATP-binding protein [Amycolatopsis sp. H20-H5]|uniref:ABC transporter ATP-binding protein n=1 Tax=Amycolatopsis sp. H20-H5 TaxID=3046309 RepID=UPI002DC063B3|nr:ABC transporter ATP-binding protein [Amycolatopsis sp. H20-H5]MEC3976815.1 ABC transporter ATP-binding protein [Amycolatopsis sp. H20-H5]
MTQVTPASRRHATANLPPPEDGDAVEVSGLRCRYGDFDAVRGIDLTVRAGEVFALLGTNGAGKTTTLEVLSGFHRPAGGTVRVLGIDPATQSAKLRSQLGVMMQEGGFVGELTTVETLLLWQRLVSRPDDPERLLARFDLGSRRDVAVAKLSGGERRRLDLALAVWGTPKLVILDEPTTGLDPESRRRAWDAIGELAEAGRTVVLTTHYLEEAEALADRVAIMHGGRIAATGTLAEITASQPARFDARIVGPPPAPPPEISGELVLGRDGPDTTVTGATDHLQQDLTLLLNWAERHSVTLEGLRAAPASLEAVYHAVRESDSETNQDEHHKTETEVSL